ncbi:NADH:ubiquinone reductase (Na(+)-transporting) subunit F [Phycicoccus avicenniae]|uniref:NADH:ubiquinone reductase (Na(+)-transporting) subunit F n=1 Tax=Phycicoccus avicenniae TaxID=2828860 RepID=UPI003D2AD0C3
MTQSHTITVEPLGREVECREDQSILEACLRSGVWLPHSCTHGTCATCKADVLEGEVDHGAASSFALMDYERDEGKLLPCTARPRSDVVIEVDIDVDESVEVFPVQDYTATVIELTEVARETVRLVVELDREIGFNAGQYLKFQVPTRDGLPAVDRTWSIASPPTEDRRLEFHIRRVPGGRGTDGWVFGGLAVGDTVSVSGPYGRFVLRTGDDRHAVLVGGGTGLAPLKSMIRHAVENGASDAHLTLYQGARTREWLYDVDYFCSLATRFPDRFTYRPCLSEETPEDCGKSADGFGFGLVTDVIAADHETLSGCAGYLCGPPPMVEAALKTLMSKRLFPRDIHREDFFTEGDRAGGGVRSPLIKR